MEFAEIILNAQNKSDWVKWLSTDKGKAATETLHFLSICYSNIPKNKMRRVKERLQVGDGNEIDAVIRELVAFEFLKRLHLQPDWSTKINGKNPDLLFSVNNEKFIADVFLVKSPKKTIRKIDDIHTEYWDKPQSQSESRSNKIAEIFKKKSNHYSQLQYPLILFAFFADNLGLDIQKVESALYGITIGDIQDDDIYPNANTFPLLCPNLSAVVACKWFDTLNRDDEGKRLQCVILHNWATNIKLPVNAFLPFGQIIWKTTSKGKYPHYEGNPNIVAKFCGEDQLEMKPYTWSKHW